MTIQLPLQPGFLSIPKEILTITKVNGKSFGFLEKGLYCYFWWWCLRSPEVYPSVMKICQDMGISSRTTVINQIKNLESKGLLKVVRGGGTRSSRYETLPLSEVIVTYPKKESLVQGTNEDPNRREKSDIKVPPSTNTFEKAEEVKRKDPVNLPPEIVPQVVTKVLITGEEELCAQCNKSACYCIPF